MSYLSFYKVTAITLYK